MLTPGPQFFHNSHNVSFNNSIVQSVWGDFNQYNGGELQLYYAPGALSADSYDWTWRSW